MMAILELVLNYAGRSTSRAVIDQVAHAVSSSRDESQETKDEEHLSFSSPAVSRINSNSEETECDKTAYFSCNEEQVGDDEEEQEVSAKESKDDHTEVPSIVTVDLDNAKIQQTRQKSAHSPILPAKFEFEGMVTRGRARKGGVKLVSPESDDEMKSTHAKQKSDRKGSEESLVSPESDDEVGSTHAEQQGERKGQEEYEENPVLPDAEYKTKSSPVKLTGGQNGHEEHDEGSPHNNDFDVTLQSNRVIPNIGVVEREDHDSITDDSMGISSLLGSMRSTLLRKVDGKQQENRTGAKDLSISSWLQSQASPPPTSETVKPVITPERMNDKHSDGPGLNNKSIESLEVLAVSAAYAARVPSSVVPDQFADAEVHDQFADADEPLALEFPKKEPATEEPAGGLDILAFIAGTHSHPIATAPMPVSVDSGGIGSITEICSHPISTDPTPDAVHSGGFRAIVETCSHPTLSTAVDSGRLGSISDIETACKLLDEKEDEGLSSAVKKKREKSTSTNSADESTAKSKKRKRKRKEAKSDVPAEADTQVVEDASEKPKPKKRKRKQKEPEVPSEADIQAVKEASEKPKTQRVKNAHDAIGRVWPEDKLDYLESVEGALLADEYYWSGAPDGQVELLVLSESHAYTTKDSMDVRLQNEYRIAGVPDRHLKLVHAISYGEPWILEGYDGSDKKNGDERGTPFFWHLLCALADELDVSADENTNDPLCLTATSEEFGRAFNHVHGGGVMRRKERFSAKVRVLEKMKHLGIMFADVCPVSIYLPPIQEVKTSKVTNKLYKDNVNTLKEAYYDVIRAAWMNYAAPMIYELKPKRLIVLGKKIEYAVGRAAIDGYCKNAGTQFLNSYHHPSYNQVRGYNYRGFLRSLRSYAVGDDMGGAEHFTEAMQDLQARLDRRKRKVAEARAADNTEPISDEDTVPLQDLIEHKVPEARAADTTPVSLQNTRTAPVHDLILGIK